MHVREDRIVYGPEAELIAGSIIEGTTVDAFDGGDEGRIVSGHHFCIGGNACVHLPDVVE